MRERSSRSPGRARIVRLDGPLFRDGLVRGVAAIGQLFGIYTDVDERGITPEWMKRQLVLVVWAVCCPARTLDRFKFTWASWLLEC